MNKVCIYLRKSRSDEELEKQIGEGETLKRHKTSLLKFAKEKKLNIVEIKEEIVSGDSLYFRPKMLDLLKEIEEDKYTGVLCMDIDRLSRGAMRDQGTIIDTFKEHKVKIITPLKTYDLDNEFDEEMTEFKTFFARRELKTITRRMQGGRVRSVEEGNYIATNPPFGYDIDFINGRSRTLKINKGESVYLQKIFEWYVEGLGTSFITERLNNLGIKTKAGNDFSRSSVLSILKNPIYIGKVTWKKKEIKKSKTPGKVKDTRTRSKDEWIIADGKHPSIISVELFNAAKQILDGRYHIPYQLTNSPVNPVAGLCYCSICGKAMVFRKLRGVERIMCNSKCGTRSVRYNLFEEKLLEALEEYCSNIEFNFNLSTKESDNKNLINSYKSEIVKLIKQKDSLFDFLERGIYTEEIFVERFKKIEDKINALEIQITEEESKKNNNENSEALLINVRNAIEVYKDPQTTVVEKNMLLKTILTKIEYVKNLNEGDELALYLHLKRIH